MANDSFISSFFNLLQSYAPQGQQSASGAPNSAMAMIDALKNGQALPTTLNQLQAQGANKEPETLVWLGKRVKVTPDRMPMNPNQLDQYTKMVTANSAKYNGAAGRVGVTPDAALNLPYTWNEKERDAAYKRVGEATGQPILSFEQFNNAWKSATQVAAQSWAATEGGKKGSPLTVWDVFDLAKREGAKYGYGENGGAGGGGSTTTHSTSSSVEKLSDGSMWQILKSTATQALGRAPSNDELQRFAARANDLAVRNPTKTSTTTTSSAGGSHSHSTTKQGASAGDYQLAAENMVNANPETGAVQASTTYFDALIRGLESVV